MWVRKKIEQPLIVLILHGMYFVYVWISFPSVNEFHNFSKKNLFQLFPAICYKATFYCTRANKWNVVFIIGDDPSNHQGLAKLPPHLREHERDPLSLNPEVYFNHCSFVCTLHFCYPLIIYDHWFEVSILL